MLGTHNDDYYYSIGSTQSAMSAFISLAFPFFVLGLAMISFMLILRLDYNLVIRVSHSLSKPGIREAVAVSMAVGGETSSTMTITILITYN